MLRRTAQDLCSQEFDSGRQTVDFGVDQLAWCFGILAGAGDRGGSIVPKWAETAMRNAAGSHLYTFPADTDTAGTIRRRLLASDIPKLYSNVRTHAVRNLLVRK